MNKLITAAAVSLTLFVTACGSDSDSSGSSTAATEAATDATEAATDATTGASTADTAAAGGTLQEQVAAQSIALAAAAGVEVDEDCIRAATAQLSDADAQMIVDSYATQNTVTVSPEGEAIGQAMTTDCLLPGS